MLFRKLRARAAERKAPPELTPLPDPMEVSTAMSAAVDAHIMAQQQKAAAIKAAEELKKTNTRNGFAPAIAFGVQNRIGGSRGASA